MNPGIFLIQDNEELVEMNEQPYDSEKLLQSWLAKLVEQMIAAKKEGAAAEDDYEKRRLDTFCADLDREIDRLVYKLYDLTDGEIAIVEEAAL